MSAFIHDLLGGLHLGAEVGVAKGLRFEQIDGPLQYLLQGKPEGQVVVGVLLHRHWFESGYQIYVAGSVEGGREDGAEGREAPDVVLAAEGGQGRLVGSQGLHKGVQGSSGFRCGGILRNRNRPR